jgi:hypothetical protein
MGLGPSDRLARGWVAFGAYFVLATTGAFLLGRRLGLFLAFELFLAVAFFAVCWFKGENPGGRSSSV